MITDRDREIINFIYDIGFSTIKHIGDVFFTESIYKYDLARKRLRKILQCNIYIKPIINKETNNTIYIPIDSNRKSISEHDISVLNYICGLKLLGCDINSIEIEPTFINVRPDALISFEFNGYRYYQIVEQQLRHNLVDIERFDNIEVKQAILNRTSGVIPSIVIIQKLSKNYYEDINSEYNVILISPELSDIAKVLI